MLAILQSQMGYLAPVPTLRTPASTVSPRMGVENMGGTGPETLNKVFDPLKFSEYGSDKTLAWCRAGLTRKLQCGLDPKAWESDAERDAGRLRHGRAAPSQPREMAGTCCCWEGLSLATSCQPRYRASEIKHGRVAMLASVGIAYTCSGGPLFAGPVALDGTTFASLGSDPWAAFAALPYQGKLQMLVVIGLLEFHSEIPSGGQKHYLNGGTPGKIMVGGFPLWDPIGFMGKLSPEQKQDKLTSELKNGRLAMIGVASFFAAHWSPIAVPLLSGKIPLGDAAQPLFGLV